MRFSLLLLVALVPFVGRAEMLIVGSDLIAPAVQPIIKAYAEHNGISIETDFAGSIPATDALQSGKASLAILAAPKESDLPAGNFRHLPIAYEVAFVVVDKLNPITEISLDQLAGIYGAGSEYNLTRWGELGVQGPMSSRSIKAVCLENGESVVTEMFKYTALDSGSLKPTVSLIADNLQVNDIASSDTGAIAITNKVLLKEKLRPLLVSGGKEESYAFGPTPENIHYGDYPLRLSFYLIYQREKQDELLPLIRSLLGSEQAEALTKAGFVPVPENIRKRTLVELDKGS
ncbi:MAG: PstS family phosphate ABC transporter substrate-binding protein [Puniceicoccales bacterium]